MIFSMAFMWIVVMLVAVIICRIVDVLLGHPPINVSVTVTTSSPQDNRIEPVQVCSQEREKDASAAANRLRWSLQKSKSSCDPGYSCTVSTSITSSAPLNSENGTPTTTGATLEMATSAHVDSTTNPDSQSGKPSNTFSTHQGTDRESKEDSSVGSSDVASNVVSKGSSSEDALRSLTDAILLTYRDHFNYSPNEGQLDQGHVFHADELTKVIPKAKMARTTIDSTKWSVLGEIACGPADMIVDKPEEEQAKDSCLEKTLYRETLPFTMGIERPVFPQGTYGIMNVCSDKLEGQIVPVEESIPKDSTENETLKSFSAGAVAYQVPFRCRPQESIPCETLMKSAHESISVAAGDSKTSTPESNAEGSVRFTCDTFLDPNEDTRSESPVCTISLTDLFIEHDDQVPFQCRPQESIPCEKLMDSAHESISVAAGDLKTSPEINAEGSMRFTYDTFLDPNEKCTHSGSPVSIISLLDILEEDEKESDLQQDYPSSDASFYLDYPSEPRDPDPTQDDLTKTETHTQDYAREFRCPTQDDSKEIRSQTQNDSRETRTPNRSFLSRLLTWLIEDEFPVTDLSGSALHATPSVVPNEPQPSPIGLQTLNLEGTSSPNSRVQVLESTPISVLPDVQDQESMSTLAHSQVYDEESRASSAEHHTQEQEATGSSSPSQLQTKPCLFLYYGTQD